MALLLKQCNYGTSDVLSWNHDNDDPTLDGAPIDIETVQVICINTSKFTSDELAEIDKLPQAVPILDEDTPAVDDPILIAVKVVAVYNGNEVHGKFDNGADATVGNFLAYLHDYKPYDRKFKCPVKLTGDVGSNNVYPHGEGKLHVLAATPGGYVAIRCFYSPHLSPSLISPRDIFKMATRWKRLKGQDMRSFFFADGN